MYSDYIDFICQLEGFRFWSENDKSKYEQQRNGISPEWRYDSHNHKEDKDKLDAAVDSHLRYIEALKKPER